MTWLAVSTAGIVLVGLFDIMLQLRQYRKLCSTTERPPEVVELVTEIAFKKSLSYQKDTLSFGLLQSASELPLTVLFLLSGLWPTLYEYSSGLLPSGYGPVTKALIFFAFAQLIEEAASLGFSLYHDFVLEEKHGFNNKTLRLFFVDKLKVWLLNSCLVAPILALAIKLAIWSGPQCYIYLWFFGVFTTILLTFLTPTLIMPLFNKYEPLGDQELKKAVEDLAAKVDYPLKKLYQMDGSKRSNHSNAFMFGFWKNKRIVLFDTLLTQKRDEIVAILAHELGHWANYHMLIGMVTVFFQMFCILFVFKEIVFREDVYKSFGFRTVNPGIGFFLFGNLFTPLNSILGFLGNLLSRRNEYQADQYAKDLGYSKELSSALIHLQEQNKSTWESDPWYAGWNYTHPTVLERIRQLKSQEKKST